AITVPEQYVSEGTEKQYVVLQATFGDVPLEKYILISPHTGYTFVQTDKPIYTPDQKGEACCWGEVAGGLLLWASGVGGTATGFSTQVSYPTSPTSPISSTLHLGTWRIVTRFQSSPRQPQSAEFEVKEYGECRPEHGARGHLAEFVFNEPVDGYALAIFGVKTETQKITLQNSLQRIEINDGKGHASLTGQVLRENFAKPEELLNAFIFVNVTVFSSGGDMMQAENSEVKIVSSPYSIWFVRTPGFFKPGMPFNFRVYVTNPDGSPASAVPVCSGDQKRTTKDGLASMVLNTQHGLRSPLQVATCGHLEPPAQQASATKTILAYETPNNSGHLLHIGVETEEARVGTSLRVLFYTEHQSSAAKQFTVLVSLLSKGRIVRAWTQPRNPGAVMTAWTLDVGPELLPSFRIVAYYHLLESAELVADAVWVDVADGCMGTVSPWAPGLGKEDERKVTGDSQAMVGLVAVDKALFALNKKNKLTQKKVWDTVEGHDIACTAGSGQNHMGVFTDAGLDVATSLGISTKARTDPRCPQPAARRRRQSLQTLQKKQQKVDQYPTALERRCCEAGIQENPMGHSCEQRTSRVHLGPACLAAFLDCCRYARALSLEERTKLLLGKSNRGGQRAQRVGQGAQLRREGRGSNRDQVPGVGFPGIGCPTTDVSLPRTPPAAPWQELVYNQFERQSTSPPTPQMLHPPLAGQLQQELVGSRHLENLVPDTDAEVFISVQGDLLGETLVGGLQSSMLQKLITLPYGCVEQNIFSVTPNIILTHYLDTTKQWDQIGVELRDRAVQNIAHGYARQRGYREHDGSYKPYRGSTSSTWYGNFRVFAMALPLGTSINPSELCASARWLIGQRQEASGCFREEAVIYTPAMQGGYHGSNSDASLTAFVLVALKENPFRLSRRQELPNGLQKAQGYLESRLRSLQNPYSVTISSYALALVNSSLANAVLDNFTSHSRTHWPVDQHRDRTLYSIEATAYGLLQKLTLRRFEETHPIVRWLVESREFGGGYESTQTTVIGMQALAQYRAAIPPEKVIDLKVRVSVPTRKLTELWDIKNSNAYLQRSSSKKLLTMYHTLPPTREHECQAFWLAVTVEEVPEAEGSVLVRRSLGLRDATMTIIDISLLTGFEPNLGDLKQLTNSVEQYIFLFESKGTISNNSVILYFNQISNQTDTEVGFRIHQRAQLGMLQPAVVSIYEYYEPARRCSRFYNVPNESGLLRKICQEEVCKCAEGKAAPAPGSVASPAPLAAQPGATLYKVQLEQREPHNSTIYYSMKVLDVIKSGTDADASGNVRRFVSHATCEAALGLREQERYLVMGRTRDLWLSKDSYTYVLGKTSFIVPWLRPEEAETDRRKKTFLQTLDNFAHFVGCDT
uniref:Complement C3 n=1 Tax=Chelonoidis abingdonii TaxID=106734 RepID=A0A8C0HCE0_CHEAB